MAVHDRSRGTGRTVARLALATLVVGTSLTFAVPAQAAPNWDTLAQCESGGRWNVNTGNGYHGGLQFSPSTWRAYGGTQYAATANQATREQQIAVAERVLAGQGPGAWPACTRKTGWNNGAGPSAAPAKKPKAVKAQKAAPRKAPRRPVAAPVQLTPKNGADYTVKRGDTLSRIAAEQGIAGGWAVVFDRNRDVIADPNLIYPDQQIDLR